MTGIALIMLAATLWAADTLIRYPLLNELSALQIVFYEHVILVGILIPWLIFKGWRPKKIKLNIAFSYLIIGGLGSAIGTLAFTQAFSLMNPTVVILVQKLQPFIAITLAAFVLNEQIRAHFLWWALLAIAATLLMILPDIIALKNATWHYSEQTGKVIMGYALALLAVIAWGSSTVMGKKLTIAGHKSEHIMGGRFLMGLAVLFPLMLILPSANFSEPIEHLDKISLMVLMSGIIGMALYYKGLKKIGSRHSAIAEMFFPFAAAVINFVVLDYQLNIYQILGGVVLVFASIMINRNDIQIEKSEIT